MTLGTILLVVLVLLLLGLIPVRPYSRGWGYAPGGIVGILVLVFIVMLMNGNI